MLHTNWAKEMAEVINSYAPDVDVGPEGMAGENGFPVSIEKAEAISEVLMIAGYGFESQHGVFRCRYRQQADCGVLFCREDNTWRLKWFTDHIPH